MSTDLRLRYGNVEVGRIRNPFYSDSTWHGTINLAISAQNGELEKRLIEYIRFCEDWNERLRRNDAADPDEFESYVDLLKSRLWVTIDEKNDVSRITEAPVFFVREELSWRSD